MLWHNRLNPILQLLHSLQVLVVDLAIPLAIQLPVKPRKVVENYASAWAPAPMGRPGRRPRHLPWPGPAQLLQSLRE